MSTSANPSAAACPQSAPLDLLHITDTHIFADDEARLLGLDTAVTLQAVLHHARQPARQRILVTGDLVQEQTPAAYARFAHLVAPHAAPLHVLPGNHDRCGLMQQCLPEAAAPVIDCGAWRLILLDSSLADSDGGSLAAAELDKLRAAASAAADRHVLVALHHSPIAMHSAWLDTMQLANAETLFALLAELPQVRALLWGHIHQAYDGWHEWNESSAQTNTPPRPPLRLMATPSTCLQFLPQSAGFAVDTALPGYRRLQLFADGSIASSVYRLSELPPDAGRVDMRSQGY